MRDLLMFSAFIFMVPMALQNGFIAYMFWAWTGVVLPNYFLFGFMQPVRFNFIFALMALGLLVMGKMTNRGSWQRTRTTTLMLCFLAHGSISAVFAASPNPDVWTIYIAFAKSMLFCLVMPFFVTSRSRIHTILIMLALGLGFHGTVEGLKVLLSGGAHKVMGLGGMMSDNNHWGVAMVMTLPILLYLYNYSQNTLVKLSFLLGFAITVISILGTNSRGAFLGMAIIGVWMVLVSRRKAFSAFVVLLAVVAIVSFAPESWFARIQTIENAGADTSFLGRLAAWKISVSAALMNPVFGIGFHGIQEPEIWGRFISLANSLPGDVMDMQGFARAAHSIYFEVLGDLGFVGFTIFLLLLFNALYTRFEIKALATKVGEEGLWARDLADLLAVAVIAYMAAGAGVSLGYFETLYAVLMLMEMTKQVLLRQIEGQQLPTTAEKAPVPVANHA